MKLNKKIDIAIAYSDEFKTIDGAAKSIGFKTDKTLRNHLEKRDLSDRQWTALANYLGVKIDVVKTYGGNEDSLLKEVFICIPGGPRL